MNGARHGGNVVDTARKYGYRISDILDFSASLNDFITEFDRPLILDAGILGTYPGSDTGLRMNLEKYTGVSHTNILPGPGLSYFIYRLAEFFREKNALMVRPSFSEYSRAFASHGINVSTCLVAGIRERIPEIMDGVFSLVCINRPDTPTGNLLDQTSLIELADACRAGDAYLFIDEAFIDFLPVDERNFSAQLAGGNNFVILGRSLTKIFSTPSLRIGYLIGSAEILGSIADLMEPWTLGNHIIESFSSLDFSVVNKYSAMVKEEREFLTGEMSSLGFTLIGIPTANYATFRAPPRLSVQDMDQFLRQRGILIRTLKDFPEFGEDFIRIAVKRREKNEILISAIKDYMQSKTHSIGE